MLGSRVLFMDDLRQPGDYLRTGEPDAAGHDSMWFVMPHAPRRERPTTWYFGWLARIAFPPWTCRECPDGSLAVQPSILVDAHGMLGDAGERVEVPGWHGYLDEGHLWRTV